MDTLVRHTGRLEYSNATGSDISSGDPVPIGNMLAVAVTDIDNGESGTVETVNVHRLAAEADEAWSQGDQLWFNSSNAKLSNQGAQGSIPAGTAAAAKAATATTGQVDLNRNTVLSST